MRYCWLVNLFLVCLLLPGCGPREWSDEELQNRKVLDAILTAVTMKNRKELAADSKLLEARRAQGHVSEGHYQALQGMIAKARSGDWSGAERELYQLRKAHPFLK
jgi:hypothetical protein